jgi:hypothetical protein
VFIIARGTIQAADCVDEPLKAGREARPRVRRGRAFYRTNWQNWAPNCEGQFSADLIVKLIVLA